MSTTYAAQINLLPQDKNLSAVLKYLCSESNKLYNCTTYLARQLYFKTGKFSNGRWLSTQMKRNPHMRALYTSAAQQTCICVGEAFKGYRGLLKLWFQGQLEIKPKPPHYRKSGGMFQISYPKRWLKIIDGKVRVPLGTACKTWFGLTEVIIPFPDNLDWSTIKELQIVPRNNAFDAVWIHKGQTEQLDLNPDNVLSIDHGIDNWLTCVSSQNDSFIVDGRHLKAINQWYNKRVAIIKQGKSESFWCKLLDQMTVDTHPANPTGIAGDSSFFDVTCCIKPEFNTVAASSPEAF